MGSPVANWKTLVHVDLPCFVVTCWLLPSPTCSDTVHLPQISSSANPLTLPVCSKIKTFYKIVSPLLSHCVSSALCYLDLYWEKTSSCSAFWHPITNSGGARHFYKQGWTVDALLCSGSFMTSVMPLSLCASDSSHQDFQISLSYFLFEGTRVLKDKGGIQYYYFYPLPAPLFFLLPSFHAAVEHLRKTCLPLSKFPTNVNWASGKRKCESWGHSWNQALAWLHIILLLCFKGHLEKNIIHFPQTA